MQKLTLVATAVFRAKQGIHWLPDSVGRVFIRSARQVHITLATAALAREMSVSLVNEALLLAVQGSREGTGIS